MFELTLSQALGGGEKKDTSTLAGSKLNKVQYFYFLKVFMHVLYGTFRFVQVPQPKVRL